MRIEASEHGDVTILSLSGEFDARDSVRLAQRLDAERRAHKIVLNVRRVRFMDAAGLGVLAGAARELEQAGGRLVVSEPSGLLRKTLGALGLDRKIPIFDRDLAAASFLRAGAPAGEAIR